MWLVVARALTLNVNVILDFGFWSQSEREDFRSRATSLGASSEICFLDVPHQGCSAGSRRAMLLYLRTRFTSPMRN